MKVQVFLDANEKEMLHFSHSLTKVKYLNVDFTAIAILRTVDSGGLHVKLGWNSDAPVHSPKRLLPLLKENLPGVEQYWGMDMPI